MNKSNCVMLMETNELFQSLTIAHLEGLGLEWGLAFQRSLSLDRPPDVRPLSM